MRQAMLGRYRPGGAGYAVVCLLVTLLAACQRTPELHREQFFAFGTLIEFTVYGGDTEQIGLATARIQQDFNTWHTAWHAWKPGTLDSLNRTLAAGKTATVSDVELLELISKSRRLSLASAGLFNPAAGALFTLWGFSRDDAPAGPVPAQAAIDRFLQQAPSMRDLDIQDRQLSSRNPVLQLDLGAIAKGYASQLATDRLRRAGIGNALVAAAGDVHAIGRRGDRPWHIGIRHPRAAGIIAATDLADGESISTSGDYERYFEQGGQRYHHLLDPYSGRPARGTASVTVIHRDGAVADAAATALFIAGPDRWPAIAKAMGVDKVMRIDSTGAIGLTPAMAERLRFENPAPEHIEVITLP